MSCSEKCLKTKQNHTNSDIALHAMKHCGIKHCITQE